MRRAAVLILVAGCHLVFKLEEKVIPPGDWRTVVAGDLFSCGLRIDDSLWCWGGSLRGALGLGVGTLEVEGPRQLGTESWATISAGFSSVCGIRLDRSLWCWGANDAGQLGLDDLMDRAVPQRVGTESWATVSAGILHTCAIRDDDRSLWCWGANAVGQLGDGTTTSNTTPVRVPGLPGWTQVTVGANHTCAIRDDETLWCWGSDANGQLGDAGGNRSVPVQIGTERWSQVVAAYASTCGRLTNNRLRCWGFNDGGALGDGSNMSRPLPGPVGGDAADWIDIAAGVGHVCGRRTGDSMWCWGANARGQVPDEDIGASTPVPIQITGGAGTWTAMALGFQHTCAIGQNNDLWCAGNNGTSQLGSGGGTRRSPTQIPGEWTSVTVGDSETCALDSAGEAWCWGGNDFGQLGDGTQLERASPVAIASPGAWDSIDLGTHFACGLRGTQRWCWGSSGSGQLGNGTYSGTAVPQQIDLPWSAVSTGPTHACAIRGSDDAGLCWGTNEHGQLGTGDVTPRAAPEPIFGGGRWTVIEPGFAHTCGLDDTRALLCWGDNGSTQYGNGTNSSSTTQTLVAAGPFDELAVGGSHGCARVGTALSCWGFNKHAQVTSTDGRPDEYEETPIPIAGAWMAVSLGKSHTCAIGADRTLSCWGSNQRGQLGDGTVIDRKTPMNIGGEWNQVSAGDVHTCGIMTDQTLWCWGSNADGAIGDGTAWSHELTRVSDAR